MAVSSILLGGLSYWTNAVRNQQSIDLLQFDGEQAIESKFQTNCRTLCRALSHVFRADVLRSNASR
jgi:hypothetical protein